jgi:hypothetical protein
MNKLYLILLTLIGLSVSAPSYSSPISPPHQALLLNGGEDAGFSVEKSMANVFGNSKGSTLGDTSEWSTAQGHLTASAHYDFHKFGNSKWTDTGEFGHRSHQFDNDIDTGSLSVPLPQSWALLMVGCAIIFGRRMYVEKAIQNSILIAA